MAAAAVRTPPNVKSSAMMPRQPEVPKWIALPAMRRYCILPRKQEAEGKCERTKKAIGAGARDEPERSGACDMRLGKGGEENSRGTGARPSRGLREFLDQPSAINLPMGREGRNRERVSAANQDFAHTICRACA